MYKLKNLTNEQHLSPKINNDFYSTLIDIPLSRLEHGVWLINTCTEVEWLYPG